MASLDYQKLLAFAESRDQKINNYKMKSSCKNLTGPDPKAIQSFIIKKQLSEKQKLEEERLKRERLLYLRSQNMKSSKAAKMMATRTKDNDYSKIVLTDKDLKIKELLETELKEKGIDNKLTRMKNRIEKVKELESDSIQIIKKKKNNTLNNNKNNDFGSCHEKIRKQKEEIYKKSSDSKIKNKPSTNPVKFEDLLKLANEKQKDKPKKSLIEEIEEEIASKKNSKNEDREERKKREEYYQKISIKKRCSKNNSKVNKKIDQNPCSSKYDIESKEDKLEDKKYISGNLKTVKEFNKNQKDFKQVENNLINSVLKSNDISFSINNLSKEQFKKLTDALANSKFAQEKNLDEKQTMQEEYLNSHSNMFDKQKKNKMLKSNEIINKKNTDQSERPNRKLKVQQKKLIDVDSLTEEELERIKKSRLEKQRNLEREKNLEKLLKSKSYNNIKIKPVLNKIEPISKPNYDLPPIGANYRSGIHNYYDYNNYDNDYYDDEEEENDDDMKDFIDDGDDPRAQSEEISKCIREVFKYDKRKYIFDSDDDIEETSYAQQLKEERLSAKLGLMEDLEDIKKEKEKLKRKAVLKKKGISFIDSDEDD